MLIGLTGNIGCGKSLVAGIMRERGVRVIDADRLAREVVAPHTPAWREIVNYFSKDILLPNQELDRKKLGKIIFADHRKRESLNSIVHPRVSEREAGLIEQIRRASPQSLIVLNVPLLIETGQYKQVDKVVVVEADRETCLRRIISRNQLTRQEAEQRFDAQMPLEEKIKFADFVIHNNGKPPAVVPQVETFLGIMSEENSSGPQPLLISL